MSKSDLQFAKNLSVDANTIIGIVRAKFNDKITQKLLKGALSELKKYGVTSAQIQLVEVPGSYEIPLAAKWLLEKGCQGVIALGAVIRGETTHYDYVCAAVERGCSQLQLEFGAPVVFGVLTTENEKQALDRVGGAHGHKGQESAATLIEMFDIKKQIFKNKITKNAKEKKTWPQTTPSL
jgi:6,7-dimethyl-8-ribityllumazine synthase